MNKIYEFDALIIEEPEHHGAYVEIPFNVKEIFGKSRVPVHATFDTFPYQGLVVKMGTPGHIIGIPKEIQKAIAKGPGKRVHVTLAQRTPEPPAITTVDGYINQFNGDIKERLTKLRALILGSSPQISEKIAWGMPTFVLGKNLVHVAAQKHHIGFYPAPSAVEAFEAKLEGYKYSKGAVQFPHNKPIPYDLIEEMVAFRIKENTKK